MKNSTHPSLKLAVYTADVWEHACPVMRITGPAQAAEFELLRGIDWVNGQQHFSLDPIEQADLVIILRDFPRHEEIYRQVVARARQLKKKIVYSTDDLLVDLPPNHPKALHFRTGAHPVLQSMLEADALIVSTPQLADMLRKYNDRIWMIPNYLDDQQWEIKPPRQRIDPRPIVVGFQGGDGHQADLEYVASAMVKILERYGDKVKFKFWGTKPPDEILNRPNVDWMFVGLVSYADFVDYFQRQECDLCIAPLVDTPFNACKSPLKFYEYSALGIPGVYSRVSVFEQVVVDGENGLLAYDIEEWEAQITRLIENADLRQHIGQAAQASVRQRWLLSDHVNEWKEAFIEIQALPPKPDLPPLVEEVISTSHRWIVEMASKIVEQEKAQEASSATIQHLQTDLNNIQGSMGWSLLMATHRTSSRLFPLGSFRGKMMRQGLKILKTARREGIRAALQRPKPGEKLVLVDGMEKNPLMVKTQPGQRLKSPGISIVVLMGTGALFLDECTLYSWLERQTYRDVEVISGDIGQPDQVRDLLGRLKGRYVCVASIDLIAQSPTYLETNLITLESEGLIFTLNALGEAGWMVDRVVANTLPGSVNAPLLRHIVRKDFLNEKFQLDFLKLRQLFHDQPLITGKLIVHTSGNKDSSTSLPFNTDVTDLSFSMLGHYICIHAFERPMPAGSIQHPAYEINTVLPLDPVPSDLPTVLVVMPVLAVGGAETVHIHVMRYLQNKIRFVMATFEHHDSSLGTTIEEFRKITPYIYPLPDFLLMNHLNFSMIEYLMARFTPQTLYIANGATWIYDAVARIKNNHPSLLIAGQVYDHQAGWINRYDRVLAEQMDVHIGINYQIDKAYVQRGVRPEQVQHIENGVDLQAFNPDRYMEERIQEIKMRLGIPVDKKVVTFMARLHEQKRPVDFIEMARRCAVDEDMIFLMVGDGPLSDTVRDVLSQTGIKNLYRQPFYKPSSDIFAISDVLVLTSEYEGMPMAVLEAQAMGCPVVATDVGNIREVLEKTQGGSAVTRVGDINGLVAAVKQVLANPIDGRAIRERVAQYYSLEQMALAYERALLRK